MKSCWLDRHSRKGVLESLSDHLSESAFSRESWDRAVDAKARADKDRDEDQPRTPE